MVYTLDQEPSVEFDTYCKEVILSWKAGDLPFKDAVAGITQKSKEAEASVHLANQGRAEHALGFLQHYRGNLNASIHHYERAKMLFQRVNNPYRVAMMDLNNGENYRLKGDFSQARRLYRAAYAVASQLKALNVMTMALTNEGLVLLTVGQMSLAYKALEDAYTLAQQWTEPQEHGLLCEIHYGLAVIYLSEGNLDAAWDAAQNALHSAELSGSAIFLGYAYRTIADVITARGMSPDAGFSPDPEEYYRLAIGAFKEMHMDAEIARTMFAHARSLIHRGRRTTAARLLQQVMILFTQLGMVDDAAKAAEAQLAVL